ncbi:hypothetical protein AB6A40_011241 [Gnathostoma spinigerum]|uniref:Uncharacterized protein n=1 Tax=Gnathostoma spinigerum TaxID=75299 RepID=A0ABD6F441_9BILA
MKEEDMIRVGLETISSHIHNLQVMKETANFVQTRIRDLLNRSDALEKQKATYNEYFLSCLKDYLALKDKLYSVQQNVRKLYVRVNQVFYILYPNFSSMFYMFGIFLILTLVPADMWVLVVVPGDIVLAVERMY